MRRRKGFRGGVHFASCRRLGVESLETRRLLAGDSLSLSQHPIDDSPAIESVSQQIQNLAVNVSASDAAGETLRTAANLGVVDGTLQRAGRLSWFDRIDVVRFEIATDAKVRITLDQLNRDANLYVLDRNGNLIGSSTRSSNRSESLSGSLPDGEYYLAISSVDYRSISYRLTLDVQTSRSQPTVSPPAAPTPVPQPSPPPEPTTVTPLAEVAYYGGSREWNLNAVAAPEAWAAGYRGQGVTVAVIDTGVDLDHPDLAGALYVNPGEIAGNGIDDDRNGFVDDVSGYDFVSGDAIADDGNGHGTHVAGTIAAGDNGFGVTGVAPDAKILPVRVLDDSGSGTDGGVAAGIRYAADLGVQIINLSLGGGISSRIASAIDYATSLGALVVAAAGNESAASPSYPARHSAESTSVLSVGAYDSSGRIAGFSNNVGGSGAVQVDAPGVSVYSTYAGGGYRSLSGTSMASPHVAAVAALTLSANPQLTSSQLRELLSSGTVGQAASSDSIGKVSTLNSVAFAAAGLTSAGGITGSDLATSSASSTQVRAAQGIYAPTPTDSMTPPTTKVAERMEEVVFPLPVEGSGSKKVGFAESMSSQAIDDALADFDADWADAALGHGDAESLVELRANLDAAKIAWG
ncbi:MAG: S8 family serine peptidase [Phycisphaera sp. RhM]|nr:S8 family serine peptidase [Phycisphaera sp. RhM]